MYKNLRESFLKQVDVLPGGNCLKHLMMSRVSHANRTKRFITKEYKATHTNLILLLKLAPVS